MIRAAIVVPRWSRHLPPCRSLRHSAAMVALVALVGAAGCAPRIGPLVGVPTVQRLPDSNFPAGHTRLVFRWEYGDPIFSAKGEGVARIAPPDSVRLDFFTDGNLGGGYAILIGDHLATPADDDAIRYLPPVPLLWAALGRLQVAGQDTVARLSGDTLRADIGRDPTWRAAFANSQLVSLFRIEGNRLRESVRRDSSTIAYRNHGSRRSLTLTLTRRFDDPPYDPSIWVR